MPGTGNVLLAAAVSLLVGLGLSRPVSAVGGSDPLAAAFPLTFEREFIRLSIVGESLEVRGTYWLGCRSPGEKRLSLFYPFPRDSLLGSARMVSLGARIDGAPQAEASWEVIRGIAGVRLLLPPCVGDTLEVEAVYRQAITPGYARYIVTTTRSWGRPLRSARFEIRLPRGAEPVDFSFPFERRGTGEDPYYGYEAESFFPDRDIIVRWRVPDE